MGYCITLVHGTFAPDSPLLDTNAALREYLQSKLNTPVLFHTFRWTGENSHAARQSAALDLQQFLLTEILPAHPTDRHFLICHSHGGTVAIYALSNRVLAMRISGVVCLATPFINCKERVGLGFYFVPMFLAAVCAVAVVLLVFSSIVRLFGGWNPNTPTPLDTDFVEAVVLLVALWYTFKYLVPRTFMAVGSFLGDPVVRWAEHRRKESLARISIPTEKISTPLLSIQLLGDEAGFWLRLLRTTSNVPYRTWIVAFISLFLIGTPVVFLWYLVAASRGQVPIIASSGLIILCLLIVALSAFLFLVCVAPIMLILPKIVRAHRFGFGGERLLDNIFLDIMVEQSPSVCENAELKTFPDTQFTENAFVHRLFRKFLALWKMKLIHSTAYTDPRVLEVIADWIEGNQSKSVTGESTAPEHTHS